MPGTSVSTRSPDRRAIRWITRIVYASSSFVPATTSSTVVIAEMTSAATSRRPESAYLDRALRQRVGAKEHDGVEHEEQEKRRRNGVRQTQRSDDRCEHRVERGDDERGQQRLPEVPDVEAGQDRSREEDARGADEERQEQSRRAQRRPHIGPEGLVTVRRGTVVGQRHGWTLTWRERSGRRTRCLPTPG